MTCRMDGCLDGWMGELIAIFTTAGNVFNFGLKATILRRDVGLQMRFEACRHWQLET